VLREFRLPKLTLFSTRRSYPAVGILNSEGIISLPRGKGLPLGARSRPLSPVGQYQARRHRAKCLSSSEGNSEIPSSKATMLARERCKPISPRHYYPFQ